MSTLHTPIDPKDALHYHRQAPAGKLSIRPTKPLQSQADLALAYSPGVAAPCKAIANDRKSVFDYTAKGNLVAVISNGTAVLGLGNIGPEASKPVMEGKAILLKRLAGIDAFDIELDATDPSEVIQIIKGRLHVNFGTVRNDETHFISKMTKH